MKKLRAFWSKAKSKIVGIGIAVSTVAMSAVTAFAEGPSVQEAVDAAKSVQQSITSVLNITAIASILAACLGAATLLFLAWWGVRKIVKVTVRAFAHGKLSI